LKRIETLLNREIGLCARSIGSTAIESGVRGRMLACGMLSVDEYLQLLTGSLEERRALVEDIVVSETWFFRDEDVFRVLTEYVNGAWRRAHPEAVLRVLSLPCATGEEAYSASISLLESGLPAARFSIHAVDVSGRALRLARLGVFGKNSFRGSGGPDRLRYFRNSGGGQALIDEARAPVTFAQGNVLDPYLVSPASFNVIFCRNLLIYLDRAARTRALDNMHNWLVPDGILFGGHAEALETLDARFERGAECGHFGYVKRKNVRAVIESSPAKPRAAKTLKKIRPAPVERKDLNRLQPERPTPAPPRPTLTLAKELADQGNLGLAVTTCERHIQEVGVSAEGYCLLGILRTALGETEPAFECFNKAVYLDPTHYTALANLALAHERRGETAAAQNFRRRAQNASSKGVTA